MLSLNRIEKPVCSVNLGKIFIMMKLLLPSADILYLSVVNIAMGNTLLL